MRASGAGVMGVGIVVTWFLTGESSPPQKTGLAPEGSFPGEKTYGGIHCSKVKKLARSFLQKQLSDSEVEQIKIHQEYCVSCRSFVESLPDPDSHTDV